MVEVVDLTKRIQEKLKNEKEELAYSKHDEVLDLCEEVFPEGSIVIAVVDGELEVSMNIEDEDTVITALYSVLNRFVKKDE